MFTDFAGTGDYTFLSTDGPSDSTLTYIHVQNAPPMVLAFAEFDVPSNEFTSFSYILDEPLGISEVSLPNPLGIYPNPSDGLAQLGTLPSSSFDVHVMDTNGRTVYQSTGATFGESRSIDLRGLDAGLYLVRVWDGKMEQTGRVVIR